MCFRSVLAVSIINNVRINRQLLERRVAGRYILSDLIYDIERFAHDFELDKVKMFVPSDYPLKSLAAASALSAYLAQVCHMEAVLVADDDKVKDITVCLPVTQNPSEIKHNANDFIAVILDCSDVEQCDNEAWNETFCILQVRGNVNMKDFGVNGYNEINAQCAAEIVYNAINKHQQEHHIICREAIDYLYLGLLDATSEFYLHIKTNTFDVITELIYAGANLKMRPQCFKLKDINEIKVLQYLYTDNIIEDKVGYIVIPKEENMYKLSAPVFTNVLEYVRYLNRVEIWVIFSETNKGKYNVFFQGSASGKFDISKMLKPYNGTGSRKKGRCRITPDQMDDILNLCKITIIESEGKKKPRKKNKPRVKKSDVAQA